LRDGNGDGHVRFPIEGSPGGASPPGPPESISAKMKSVWR
jgi:hypothetical protein